MGRNGQWSIFTGRIHSTRPQVQSTRIEPQKAVKLKKESRSRRNSFLLPLPCKIDIRRSGPYAAGRRMADLMFLPVSRSRLQYAHRRRKHRVAQYGQETPLIARHAVIPRKPSTHGKHHTPGLEVRHPFPYAKMHLPWPRASPWHRSPASTGAHCKRRRHRSTARIWKWSPWACRHRRRSRSR